MIKLSRTRKFADSIPSDIQKAFSDLLADVYDELNSLGGGVSSGLFPGIYGMQLSNNASDVDHDIDITAGYCYDSTMAKLIQTEAMTKQLDATWATGTNAGLLQSGQSIGASKTYWIYAICSEDGRTTDFIATEYNVAVVLPSGYVYSRRVLVVQTDASSNILGVIHYRKGNVYHFKTRQIVVSGWSIPTSATLQALGGPLGIKTIPIFHVTSGLPAASAALCITIWSPGQDEWTPGSTDATATTFDGTMGVYFGGNTDTRGHVMTHQNKFITNTDNQLYFKRVGTYYSSNFYSKVFSLGYVDFEV